MLSRNVRMRLPLTQCITSQKNGILSSSAAETSTPACGAKTLVMIFDQLWRHTDFSVGLTYLLTYLLTSWSRVLLEKLTDSQLVEKFPAIYGTRRFITAFTSARHLSLSWARSFQSIPPHPTSWRSILILSPFCALVFHVSVGLWSLKCSIDEKV